MAITRDEYEQKLAAQAREFEEKLEEQRKHYDRIIKKITDLESDATAIEDENQRIVKFGTAQSRLPEVSQTPKERKTSKEFKVQNNKKRPSVSTHKQQPAKTAQPPATAKGNNELTIIKTVAPRRVSTTTTTDAPHLPFQNIDVRTYFITFDPKPSYRPKVNSGVLWEDPDFTPFQATSAAHELDWKRPGEVSSSPTLYSNTTTSFDIDEGGMGICWFLPILMIMPDRREVLEKVIPEDSYRIGKPNHDGVFHCRFWRFGRWEDIFIDDRLPVYKGTNTLWGVTNRQDKDEMWPALLEKAYAKFQGSYDLTSGGWATTAFLLLTGGVTETIKFKSATKSELVSRLEGAISHRDIIFTNVKEEADKTMGLKAHDLYTFVQLERVPIDDQITFYCRINNVLGTSRWLGQLPDEAAAALEVFVLQYGEFWLRLDDFLLYFDEVDICNAVPDMNLHMSNTKINKNLGRLISIRGEWRGVLAAGTVNDDQFICENSIFDNPKFHLTIGDSNSSSESSREPILIQVFQGYKTGAQTLPQFALAVHFYKIDFLQEPPQVPLLVLAEKTNDKVFRKFFYTTYRYWLEPGDYLIVPSTLHAEEEQEFLLRIFSRSSDVEAKFIDKRPHIFLLKSNLNPIFDQSRISLDLQRFDFFGEWKSGLNAGGQVRYRTFARNPQFVVTGNDNTNGFLLVSLKQPVSESYAAIGFHVMLVEEPIQCTNYDYIKENYRREEVKEMFGKNTFVKGGEVEGLFVLSPKHNLVVIVFQDEPDRSLPFCLTLGTNCLHPLAVKEVHASHVKGGQVRQSISAQGSAPES